MNLRARDVRRWAARSVAMFVVVAVLIQFVPVGRDHTNPPITEEAPWAAPSDRRLAAAACYDCHSNGTKWQWYTSVAPVSWWTTSHVDEGRAIVNFSEWDRRQDAEELVESVKQGSMPPTSYGLLHVGARLSAAERRQLIRALQALPEPGR